MIFLCDEAKKFVNIYLEDTDSSKFTWIVKESIMLPNHNFIYKCINKEHTSGAVPHSYFPILVPSSQQQSLVHLKPFPHQCIVLLCGSRPKCHRPHILHAIQNPGWSSFYVTFCVLCQMNRYIVSRIIFYNLILTVYTGMNNKK